jgi:hypothetical protein
MSRTILKEGIVLPIYYVATCYSNEEFSMHDKCELTPEGEGEVKKRALDIIWQTFTQYYIFLVAADKSVSSLEA